MNIYIDEAGSFIPTDRENYMNCVVAVIVPSHREKYLFDGYLDQRTFWESPESEIKGSKMDEKQIAYVLKLLAKCDVLVEVCAICTSGLEDEGITEMKLKQAAGLMRGITPQHHPNFVTQLEQMRERIEASPNQLYLQSFAMTQLLASVLHIATGFWAQRHPAELATFQWRVDAKDTTITEAEDRWRKLFPAYLQTSSLSEPLAYCTDPSFDYSHLEKFEMSEDSPDQSTQRHMKWLRKVKGTGESGPPMKGLNMGKIFKDFKFENSKDDVGLQLADIVASAFHRAFKNTLQKDGWRFLAPLFVNRKGGVVDLIFLANDGARVQLDAQENLRMRDILATMDLGARSMWVSY